MYIQFSYEPELQEYIELPIEKMIPLVQAIPLLNSASAELTALGKEGAVSFLLYREQGDTQSILDADIHLPIVNGTTIEAIQQPIMESDDYSSAEKEQFLSLFGKTKKSRGLPKVKQSKVKPPVNDTKEKQEKKIFPVKWLYLATVPLVLLLTIGGFLIGQSTTGEKSVAVESMDQLEKKVNALEDQLAVTGQLDTFSRFFITNYFSGKKDELQFHDQVKPFVDKELLQEIKPTQEKVKSILPWTMERKGEGWQVAYVVTLETIDNKTDKELMTFLIKEENGQYIVSSVPQRERFSIN